MALKLNVIDHELTAGGEWVVSSYPGEGVYRINYAGHMSVAIVFNNCVQIATGAGAMVEEDEVFTGNTQSSLVDSDLILKVLAVAQKPELARELCR